MNRPEHFKISMLFSTEIALGKILFIGLELLLLVLIIQLFKIQDSAFQNLSLMILGGFLVNAFLAQRYRGLFFMLYSMASVPLILGLANGAWVLGIGLVLIGVTYLPVAFSLRLTIIALIAAALVGLRLGWVAVPWEVAVWQILGAMFMFRMIIYLYDIKHEKRRPDWKQTVSYFFMIPTVCFPLFPVVDYKKFLRSHYSGSESWQVYQRGVSWIFRGLVHLLLYRLVYQYMTIDPVEASGLIGVLHFSFSSFALYLQVSGLFHLIVGILLLFGFNLPETNHLYFLASNFNDFWRRINIYWKDFMMKIFYYPVYFKVRKLGETRAIIISTVVVFFATWFLHAYQWFWLRGAFLLEWHDALYWAVLAGFVILNSLYETRYGRDRSLGAQRRGLYDHLSLSLSTAATFLTLGLLWGMWSSDTLGQWVTMWATTGQAWLVMVVLIPALFATSWGFGQLAKRRRTALKGQVAAAPRKPAPSGFWRPALNTALAMGMVYALGHTAVYSRLPGDAAEVLESVRIVGLNKRDQRNLERGYYENLVGVNRNSRLWQANVQRPADWNKAPKGVYIPTNDFRGTEMAPNLEFNFKGAKVTSNRWGMRDRDYELEKPADTTRIALLGPSHIFGSGVNNDQTFEAVLEKKLNSSNESGHHQTEILNFSLPGRTAVRLMAILEYKAFSFDPDIVFYVGHKDDAGRVTNSVAKRVFYEYKIPYPGLQAIIDRAGVEKNMDLDTLKNRFSPFGNEILAWAYTRIVQECRQRGIIPIYILQPMTSERLSEADTEKDITQAKTAGFTTIDMREVFRLQDPDSLGIAKWDNHPNAKAHRLIAELLFETMRERGDEILEKQPATL